MKIVVIGGSGLIGAQTVRILKERGHQVVAASPSTGVNAITGQGLAEALQGADVLIDVANAPSWEDEAVLAFFRQSTQNLLRHPVAHYLALSVVGTERLQESGYFRAKLAQEELISQSGRPYTIVRATQFFEFLGGIAQSGTVGDEVRLPAALFQPIAAADVSEAMADFAEAAPANAIVEVGGPQKISMAAQIEQFLKRPVVADPKALYFGMAIDDHSLTAGNGARLGSRSYQEWAAAR